MVGRRTVERFTRIALIAGYAAEGRLTPTQAVRRITRNVLRIEEDVDRGPSRAAFAVRAWIARCMPRDAGERAA